MIPKKRTEEDIRASFELILKDHSHITNLTKLEVQGVSIRWPQKIQVYLKHSDKIEGHEYLLRTMRKLGMEGPPLDKVIEDKSEKSISGIMEENSCGFILHFSDGIYLERSQ
jgi:hypothetical protein